MLSLRSRLTALTEVSDYESDHERHMSPEEEAAKRTRKRDRKRKKIIRELLESEKAYIHHLELVHKHFDFPLRFACIVPDEVHQKLFSNLEQILEVNRQLLEELEHSTVGLSFLHLGPFLKLYATYANDHEQALSTLQDWHQRSSSFSDFISMQEQRHEVNGLKLNALLITPVQRVPRYQMLLEDLLEHTSPDHHDFNNLSEATKKIKEVAWHINEHIRQHENFQKMLDIQNRLSGSAPKILAPGRLFIKEGCLKKVSRKSGRSLERMFFLFSDMLLYAKPKLLDSGKNTYTCCCVLPLKHCKIEPVFGKPRKDQEGGMFRISCQSESLLLYSSEPGVVNEWSDELVSAVRRFNKNRRTLRKPSSNKTPVRGTEMIRNKKPDKKNATPTLKRPLEPVVEDAPTESPCLKDSLHPMRLQMSALRELDLTNCLSPRKRARKEVPVCEMNSENLTPGELISPADPEEGTDEGSGQKLSVTLGSMELTEESLTNENFDLSVDFLGASDRYTRPPLRACLSERSYYRSETHTDSPCHPQTVYSNIRNRVQQQNTRVIEAAVVNCVSGFQSAYDQLKSPATSRCVIL